MVKILSWYPSVIIVIAMTHPDYPVSIVQSVSFSATLTSTNSADLSTLFDFGGILGGVFAGAVTDYYGKSATVCCVMLIISIPLVWLLLSSKLLYYL